MNTWPTANDGLPRQLESLGERERRVYEAVRDWQADRTPSPRWVSPSVLHLAHFFRGVMNAAQLLEILDSLEDKHLLMPGEMFPTPTHQFRTFVAKAYDPHAEDAVLLRAHVPAPKPQQELFV